MDSMALKVGVTGLATLTVACAIIAFADKFYNTMKGLMTKSHAVSSVIEKERKQVKDSSRQVEKEKSSKDVKNKDQEKQEISNGLLPQSKEENGGRK